MALCAPGPSAASTRAATPPRGWNRSYVAVKAASTQDNFILQALGRVQAHMLARIMVEIRSTDLAVEEDHVILAHVTYVHDHVQLQWT